MSKSGWVFLSVFVFGLRAFASDVPQVETQVVTLSLKSAVALALEQNPGVVQAKEKLEQDNADKWTAVSKALPSVNLTGGAESRKDPVNTAAALFNGLPYNEYTFLFQANQPLFDGGAALFGIKAANKQKDINTEDLAISERDLSLQVIEVFYTILLNENERLTYEAVLGVDRESLKTAQRWYKIGRGQLLDVLQIQSQIATLMSQIATVSNQVDVATAQLVNLLGKMQVQNVAIQGNFGIPDWRKISETAQGHFRARTFHVPELSKNLEQQDQLLDEKNVTMASYWPQLGAFANWGRNAFTKVELLDDFSDQWAIGLQLSFPIFSGLSSVFQSRSYASQMAQLDAAHTQIAEQVDLGQIQAKKGVELAQSVMNSSHDAANFGRKSSKEATRLYGLHTIDYITFLTTQANYLTAEVTYQMAKYSFIDSIGKYYQASGLPMAEYVEELNSLPRSAD